MKGHKCGRRILQPERFKFHPCIVHWYKGLCSDKFDPPRIRDSTNGVSRIIAAKEAGHFPEVLFVLPSPESDSENGFCMDSL